MSRGERTIIGSKEDASLVRRLDDAMAESGSEKRGAATLRMPSGEEIELPEPVLKALAEAIHEMALGRAVRVLAADGELTSSQAADLLNVSRPFLVSLLERGEIPFRRVGSHRRVRLEDLLSYKEGRDKERRDALNALASESQDLGLYEER